MVMRQSKKKEHKVTLFETHTCGWCAKVREFFKEHKIKHKSIYVDKDHKAAQEMIEKSGQMGVPVIEIDGNIIVGYNPEALAKALGIKT